MILNDFENKVGPSDSSIQNETVFVMDSNKLKDEQSIDNVINQVDCQRPEIDDLIEALQQDERRLTEGEPVSNMAFHAPHINSGTDKKSGLGRTLARRLFPATDEERVGSYIAYRRLLSKLRGAYRSQIAKNNKTNKIRNNPFQQVRAWGNRELFEQLLSSPLSESILNPEPMPVEIAPYDELEPFFTHMRKGEVANGPYQEFSRGAYYNDGRIDMCKQVVGNLYIGELVDSIWENPHVEHFLLGNNVVGDEGAKKIASLMRDGPKASIQTFYLAGNCITEKGTAELASSLATNQQVESLWLKRNPLKAQGVMHIAKMLETNTSVHTLDLVNVGMLDEGAKYLFDSLKKNHTLRTLYIDANGISQVGAQYIADYFEYLKSENRVGLTGLFMGINRIGDIGTKIIANALSGYLHITRLDLSSNRVQNDGLKTLLDACDTLPKLAFLGIGLYKSTSDLGELPNYFDGIGADLFVDFIHRNRTVQVLGISDTNLREWGLDAIANALEKNYTIMELIYHQYRLAVPTHLATRIQGFLERNTRKRLGISAAEFKDGPMRQMKHSDQIGFIDSIYRNNMKD